MAHQRELGRKTPAIFWLVFRPQFTNQVSTFTDRLCTLLHDSMGNQLVSVSVDGCAEESDFVMKELIGYCSGKNPRFLMPCDLRHTCKALRNAVLTGSAPRSLGPLILNPQVLVDAGLSQRLVQIKDWASDDYLYRLTSSESIDLLLAHESQGRIHPSYVRTWILVLYHIRILLAAITSTTLETDFRIECLWSGLLFMLGINNLSAVTQTNLICTVLPLVLALSRFRNHHVQPRYMSSEAAEHFFGICRMRTREFTFADLVDLEGRIHLGLGMELKYDSIDFSQPPGESSGYATSFKEYMQSASSHSDQHTSSSTMPSSKSPPDPSPPEVFRYARPLMLRAVKNMQPFLRVLQTQPNHLYRVSSYNSLTSLLRELCQYFPRTFDSHGYSGGWTNSFPRNVMKTENCHVPQVEVERRKAAKAAKAKKKAAPGTAKHTTTEKSAGHGAQEASELRRLAITEPTDDQAVENMGDPERYDPEWPGPGDVVPEDAAAFGTPEEQLLFSLRRERPDMAGVDVAQSLIDLMERQTVQSCATLDLQDTLDIYKNAVSVNTQTGGNQSAGVLDPKEQLYTCLLQSSISFAAMCPLLREKTRDRKLHSNYKPAQSLIARWTHHDDDSHTPKTSGIRPNSRVMYDGGIYRVMAVFEEMNNRWVASPVATTKRARALVRPIWKIGGSEGSWVEDPLAPNTLLVHVRFCDHLGLLRT